MAKKATQVRLSRNELADSMERLAGELDELCTGDSRTDRQLQFIRDKVAQAAHMLFLDRDFGEYPECNVQAVIIAIQAVQLAAFNNRHLYIAGSTGNIYDWTVDAALPVDDVDLARAVDPFIVTLKTKASQYRTAPALSKFQWAVYQVIAAQPSGKGITRLEILDALLKNKSDDVACISEDTLKDALKSLTDLLVIQNTPRAGYSILSPI